MKWSLLLTGFALVLFAGFVGFHIGNNIGKNKVYDQYGSALVKCVDSTEAGTDWSVYAVCLNDNFFKGDK